VIYIEFFPYCLFVSSSLVIGCEDRLRNDLYCAGRGVKLYSIQSKPMAIPDNVLQLYSTSYGVRSTFLATAGLLVGPSSCNRRKFDKQNKFPIYGVQQGSVCYRVYIDIQDVTKK